MKEQRFQFAHVNLYSRSLSTLTTNKGGARWTIADIAAEARRDADNSHHVINKKEPVIIAGCTLFELENKVNEKLEAVRIVSKKGVAKKIRSDAKVLAAAIYSWPEAIENLEKYEPGGLNPKALPERINNWIEDVIKFQEKEFNSKILCAAVHLDEGFPHLHVYSLCLDNDGKMLHPGFRDKEQTIKEVFQISGDKNIATKSGNRAYIAAMKLWQDRFYEEVSQFHGMDRLGPRRQRTPTHLYRSLDAKIVRQKISNSRRKARDQELNAINEAALILGKVKDASRIVELAEKLTTGNIKLPEIQPSSPLDSKKVYAIGLSAAGTGKKILGLGQELFTQEQMRTAIKASANEANLQARSIEQKRFEPLINTAKEISTLPGEVDELIKQKIELTKEITELNKIRQVTETLANENRWEISAQTGKTLGEVDTEVSSALTKNDEFKIERHKRILNLLQRERKPLIGRIVQGAIGRLAQLANMAIRFSNGDWNQVNWNSVEEDAARDALNNDNQPIEAIIQQFEHNAPTWADPQIAKQKMDEYRHSADAWLNSNDSTFQP
ncbi:plasmid recombination protein (plasmid) [Deefgea piscis]|uniref:Plasmid recombination protein n=1 Tax=Deefgea piscis TaxID=2739061 RepID=A0A6M8SSU9_9NEIS|nr:plasmid recombination protein [Deefgea piscis]QKJ68255.1 plasmid recombination protein [Deefgea piscis]